MDPYGWCKQIFKQVVCSLVKSSETPMLLDQLGANSTGDQQYERSSINHVSRQWHVFIPPVSAFDP